MDNNIPPIAKEWLTPEEVAKVREEAYAKIKEGGPIKWNPIDPVLLEIFAKAKNDPNTDT